MRRAMLTFTVCSRTLTPVRHTRSCSSTPGSWRTRTPTSTCLLGSHTSRRYRPRAVLCPWPRSRRKRLASGDRSRGDIETRRGERRARGANRVLPVLPAALSISRKLIQPPSVERSKRAHKQVIVCETAQEAHHQSTIPPQTRFPFYPVFLSHRVRVNRFLGIRMYSMKPLRRVHNKMGGEWRGEKWDGVVATNRA